MAYEFTNNRQLTILVDLDEVLGDFLGSFCRLFKLDLAETIEKRSQSWSLSRSLGMSDDEFAQPILDAGREFWAEVAPLPWMDDLIRVVRKASSGDWHIVTAPMGSDGPETDDRQQEQAVQVYAGKVAWIKRHFGYNFDRFFITAEKYMLAAPDRVLIDDSAANVNRFIKAGGRGILFPAAHNRLYAYCLDPVPYVTECLYQIQKESR